MEIEVLESARTHVRQGPRFAAAASLAGVLCRFRLWRKRPVPSDCNHSLDRESSLRRDFGFDCDVVLQPFERAQHFRKRSDFHESTNGELARRIKRLRRILPAK